MTTPSAGRDGGPATTLLGLDLVAAARAVHAGEVSPVQLTEAYLDEIARTEPALNAYVTVDHAGALAAARTATAEIAAGRWRGPLHGLPVGVKDVLDTAGLRTTYGSPRFAAHVPAADATVVERLRTAGAVILGKHATHELAWGGRTDSGYFGPTRNPHDAGRVPGGSSGGGAASVVAGSSLLAIGTDTAGSVRIPAALSGCVGLKPAYGWQPLHGIFPLAASLDHVGLLARSVSDIELAWTALHASSPTTSPDTAVPPESRPGSVAADVGPGMVAMPTGSALVLDPAVRAGLDQAVQRFERAGLRVVEVADDDAGRRAEAILTLVRAEAELVHRDAFAADPESYGPDLAELLALGPVSDTELATAQTVVGHAKRWLAELLTSNDAVLTATVPIVAPPIGQIAASRAGTAYPIELLLTRLTSVANVAGLPAISVPAPTAGPLPVGVQLVSRSTQAVLALARPLG